MKPTRTWKFLQGICRVVTTCMFDLKVYGTHYFPAEGPVLLVSSHQSYLDPVLVGVRLRRTLSYMAKSELFRFAPFAWLIRSLGAFPVKQGAGDVRAIKEAIERLRGGHALAIFPEGSRTSTGELLPIEPGIALVIRKAGVPVVPAVIDGAIRAWPQHLKVFRPAPIRVLFGPPMDLSSLDRDEIIERIGNTFHEMLDRLRHGDVPPDRPHARRTPIPDCTAKPLPHPPASGPPAAGATR